MTDPKPFSIPTKTIPWLLLGVCVLSFGLLIPALGFYWDDWLTLYQVNTHAKAADIFYGDYRPLHALFDVWHFRLFGNDPLSWHIFSLLARWLAAVLVWKVLLEIWPEREEFALWAALLFAIYPTFRQQSFAVIYRQHWLTYIFFLLSLLAMLRAVRQPERRLHNTLLGLAAALLHLFTTEYLIGLELLRPVLLWLVIAADSWKAKLRPLLAHWAGYFVILLGFVYWRLFALQLADDPNPPVMLYDLLERKLAALRDFALLAGKDVLRILATSWYDTLQIDLLDLSQPFNLATLGVAVLAAAALAWLAGRVRFSIIEETRWQAALGVIALGLVAILLGLAPAWVTGRQITVGLYSDRLSIPAMFGAALALTGMVFLLFPARGWRRALIFSALIGLAIGLHLRSANEMRWEWAREKDIYWQMAWRAPSIDHGTLIIPDGSLTGTVSRYNAAFALNLLYPHPTPDALPDLWVQEFFTGLHRHKPEDFAAGFTVSDTFYSVSFEGISRDSLFLYTPGGPRVCIWLLSPLDVNNNEIPAELRAVLASSSLNAIQLQGTNGYPPTALYGPEAEHGWCYYYQKMTLAQQYLDWQTVIDLGAQAEALDLEPSRGYEYLPLINAYAQQSDWTAAAGLTIKAYRTSFEAQAILCAAWEGYLGYPEAPSESALADIRAVVGCPLPEN